MDYIRYQEAEKLYKLYPTLQAVLESLQVDLNSVCEQESLDDDIYAECMGKHGEGIIPPKGTTTDITGNVASRYRVNLKIIEKEIKKDILGLSAVIEKISVGINSLTRLQRIILETYYWSEQKTWKQVVEALKEHGYYKNKDQCMAERRKGISKLVSIARLSIETYAWVMDFVGEDKQNDKIC